MAKTPLQFHHNGRDVAIFVAELLHAEVQSDCWDGKGIIAEKAKVLQILVNLIRNAKYACDDGPSPSKVMTLRIVPGATPDTSTLLHRAVGPAG